MHTCLANTSFEFSRIFQYILHVRCTILDLVLEISIFETVSKLWLEFLGHLLAVFDHSCLKWLVRHHLGQSVGLLD